MNAFWLEHQVGVVVFLAVLVVIALSNLGALRRLGTFPAAARYPRVSVLVPMRNEERNVRPVLESLLGQQYPDFEVVALDDDSIDRTGAILSEMAGRHARLRVIAGSALPEGWHGKQWACHRLAQAATGELLLFTDADTRHGPDALRHAVSALVAERADLVSAVPKEEVRTWAEKLVVPVVPWAIIAFLPLRLAQHWRRPAFTAANGQFLLIRREAYERAGGHEAVRASVVDDLALVRRIVRAGMRWRLFDAQDDVSCRMYENARQVFDGFSKNLFGAFGFRVLPFAFVWLWLGVVTFQPLVVLVTAAAGADVPALSVGLAGAAVGLALALWAISHAKFRFPFYLVPLYPLSTALAIGIAARSVGQAFTGRAEWKGRRLPGWRRQ